MKYRAMLPDQMGIEVEADSDEEAQKKALDLLIKKLQPDDMIVWEDDRPTSNTSPEQCDHREIDTCVPHITKCRKCGREFELV